MNVLKKREAMKMEFLSIYLFIYYFFDIVIGYIGTTSDWSECLESAQVAVLITHFEYVAFVYGPYMRRYCKCVCVCV